jgi:hypothetical protein
MRRLHQFRQFLAMPTGMAAGFLLTAWTTVHAAALLPNLFLGGVSDGATVSGVVPLTAQADATGLAGLQFQISGANLGPEITTGSCSTNWDTRTVPNGSRTISAVGRDSLGNTVYTTPIVVNVQNTVVDTAVPTVALSAPTASATVAGNVMVTASATDNVGVAGVWFTLDGANLGSETASGPYQTAWTTTATTNGSHVLRAFARDAAGNTAGSPSVTVNVSNAVADTTHPTVTVSAPANGATVSGTVSVAASASDNVAVVGVQFKLDGANLSAEDTLSPYSVSWSTTGASNGSHTLVAVARDAAGNSTTSSPITVTVNNVAADTTVPTVSLSAPVSGATVSATTTVSATASDNVGVAGVQFTLDNVNIGAEDTTAPYAISWNTTSVTNGSHTLRAVARDAAGNKKTSASRTITVSNAAPDTTKPTVSISAPANNSTVAGTLTVSAAASDNVGVVGVQFTLDGASLGAEATAAPFATTWVTTSASSGIHTLRAVARDAAGNSTTSAGVVVTVNNTVQDTVLPVVSLTSPAGGSTVASGATLAAVATDNVGVVGVQFFIDGIAYGAEDLAAPFQTAWATASLPNGSYTLTAVARDAAGNRATSAPVTVSVANQTQVASAAPGDFDGDGAPDLLWESTNGKLYLWLMSGSTLSDDMPLTPKSVDSNWQIVSVDDFDGDGKNDVLWQHAVTGQLYVWLMNGASMTSSVALPTVPGRVETTGDFNGDGKPDIIYRDPATGDISVLFMNGTAPLNGTPTWISHLNPSWTIAGAGDVNRDGKIDLICQNTTTGALQVLYMNGAAIQQTAPLTPALVAPSWRLKAVADYNRDGSVDLVWQSTTGYLYVWYMNGAAMVRGEYLTPGQTNSQWQIVGGR